MTGRERERREEEPREPTRKGSRRPDREAGAERGGEAHPSLEDEITSLRAQLEELNGKWLRTLADLDNYRKRTERERRHWTLAAKEEVLVPLLDVVDDLERALEASEEDAGPGEPALREGVALIFRRLVDVLHEHAVEPIDSVGSPFDPTVHEAVAQVEADGYEPNTVVEEMRRGYTIGDRLLRPARVVVAK